MENVQEIIANIEVGLSVVLNRSENETDPHIKAIQKQHIEMLETEMRKLNDILWSLKIDEIEHKINKP